MFEDLPVLSPGGANPNQQHAGVVLLPNSGYHQGVHQHQLPHQQHERQEGGAGGALTTNHEAVFIQNTFDQLLVPQGEVSDLRLELMDRTRSLHEAQQKLSDQRVMLQEEREKSARLLSENASHHCQGEDDRGRIAQLLRITRGELTDGAGVVEDVPLVVRPVPGQSKRLAKRANETMSLRSFVVKGGGATSIGGSSPGGSPPGQAGGGGSPSDVEQRLASALQAPPGSGLVIALRNELEQSKNQLDEQRQTFELDREARMGEERARYRQQEDSLLKYKKTVDHLQVMLNETTRDLCLYRHTAQKTERELRGEVEALTAHVVELESGLDKEKCRRTADMKESLYAAAVRSNDVLERVRYAARDKELSQEEKLRTAQTQVVKLDEEMTKLRLTVKEARKKTVAVERRYRLQEEGLRSELDLCKQELRAVQKRVYFNFQREGGNAAANTSMTAATVGADGSPHQQQQPRPHSAVPRGSSPQQQ